MSKPAKKGIPSQHPPRKKLVTGRTARSTREPAPAKGLRATGAKGCHVVATCPEFTLYSDGRVQSSPKVDRAMLVARFANNSRAGKEDRLNLKIALWNLTEHAAGQFTGDCEDLLDDITGTLGAILLDALNHADETTGKKVRMAVKKTGRALADVESAIVQMARFRTTIPIPGDNSSGAWTHVLQSAAKEIFRETKRQPRQREIWARLDEQGWMIGGNDRVERRNQKMIAAGLETLPM